jgi:hypothetical protein
MEDLAPEEKEKIIRAIESKGAKRPCPRCGSSNFSLVSGYFNHFIQSQLGGVRMGGPSIPTAVVACNQCGWLAEHALGVLDLLPEDQTSRPENKS